MQFPKSIKILVKLKNSSTPIAKCAVRITVFAHYRNNYMLTLLTDDDGSITLKKEAVEKEIYHSMAHFPMDYASPLSGCDPRIRLDVLSIDEIRGMSMYLPLYSRPGWDALSFRGAYPPDSITEEDVYYLSAEKANDFVKQLLGIEIPELDVEGEFSDVICKDGKYAVAPQDIYMPDYLVSAYRYIGDGMFYVVYDEDDYATPGAEEEHHGISPNEKQMIVRRSSTSAWGFIVISKLKGGYVRIIPEGFAHPEGMTYIVNSSMIFDQQP